MAKWQDYNEYFEKASTTYGVDKQLLIAVAKTESNFDAKATSGVGAKGIMQLMDSTAKSLGVKNSYDPEENIMGGAKYLSQLLKQYNGDTDKALASYNGGSGNVAKYGKEKYSKYYKKVYANKKELFGDDPLAKAEETLRKKADEVVKESDEKYWGEDKSLMETILNVTLTILCGVGAVVFIGLAISNMGGLDIKGKFKNVSRETSAEKIEKSATNKIDTMIKNGNLEEEKRSEYIKREIKHQNKRKRKRGVKK